jgi:hypothetical protein
MLLAVDRHLRLLENHGARILYHNALEPTPPWIRWTAPDLCVLHTTFLGARWHYDFETYRRRFRWVAALDCPKVALPQDEYDHAATLDEWLLEFGVKSVYSCFGAELRPILYPTLADRATFHETLTGFIDEEAAGRLAARMIPHARRPNDIVYRATKLPYWFGSHGQLKHRIADVVEERAGHLGLRTDISTRPEDTIYGDGWLDFMMSGRAVIGTESGSSVLDAHGEIRQLIGQLLADQPDLTMEQVDAWMPAGWDSHAFFAISPRHLEAVVTKTAQILVEGRYSGVLEPERHYIPLRRDFSNLDEALGRLQDAEEVEAMAERAYDDVYLSGRHNLETLATRLLEEAGRPRKARIAVPLSLATLPSLPGRPTIGGIPVHQLLPRLVTLVEALAGQREAREVLAAAVRGRLAVPLKDIVRELILLRVLARIRNGDGTGGEAWSLSAENDDGTVVIRTHVRPHERTEMRLDGRFEHMAWNHSAAARAVPIFPQHPRWGWISLGLYGRYEFTALAGIARMDESTARALLARALEG